jgi:hypothetical protein
VLPHLSGYFACEPGTIRTESAGSKEPGTASPHRADLVTCVLVDFVERKKSSISDKK